MRLVLVALLLLTAVAAPARADDGWLTFSFSPDVTQPFAPTGSADVGPDGTQIRAWTRDAADPVASDVVARAGSGPPVVVGRTSRGAALQVFAGTGGVSAVKWNEDTVAFARPDGTFTASETLAGPIARLSLNAAGDAAVLLRDDNGYRSAFRPTGGTFGAPVDLGGNVDDFALSAAGETLVADGPFVRSRTGDGPFSAPIRVFESGFLPRLRADETGRVLAVACCMHVAVRSSDGTWSAPVSTEVGLISIPYSLAVNARGDAIIAWRDVSGMSGYAFDVHTLAGSLAEPHFPSQLLDGDSVGQGVGIGIAPDGSAAIAYGDEGQVRIVRRVGVGPFGRPQSAACGHSSVSAYLPDGRVILDSGTAWNEPLRTVPSLNCARPPAPPKPVVTPTRVYAGEPVAIDVSPLRQSDWPVESVDVAWTDGAAALPPRSGDPATLIRHAFPRIGMVPVNVVVRQHRPVGCCSVDRAAVVTVPVLSRASLAVRRSGRRHLRVRVAAETPGAARPVTIRVRRDGRVVGRRTVNALATPRTVHVPLRRRVRGSVRVVLRQAGRTVAKPVVVAL